MIHEEKRVESVFRNEYSAVKSLVDLVMSSSKLVDTYLSMYPNRADEFSFKAVWIVGPTAKIGIHLKADWALVRFIAGVGIHADG
jgi:hypothetical protein